MRVSVVTNELIDVLVEDELDLLITLYVLKEFKENIEIIKVIDWQFKRSASQGSGKLGRVRVKVSIQPLKFVISSDLKSIRVTGRVLSSSLNEGIKGRTLGVDINVGDTFTLKEVTRVTDILLLRGGSREKTLVVVLFDEKQCSLLVVNDTIVEVENIVLPCGKYYLEEGIDPYDSIRRIVKEASQIAKRKGELLIIAAPSTFKRYVSKLRRDGFNFEYVDVDMAGIEGLFQLIKRDEIRKRFNDNRLVSNYLLTELIPQYLSRNKIVYGVDDISYSITVKSIGRLILNKNFIVENLDLTLNWIINMLKQKAEVIITDEWSPLGVAVSKLGGAIGLLKY